MMPMPVAVLVRCADVCRAKAEREWVKMIAWGRWEMLSRTVCDIAQRD